MVNNNRVSSIVFSVYILVAFYVFGGGIVNSLVGYRTWRAVGVNEFPKFHQIDGSLIIPLFVVFFFFSFIPQILLFWFRPVIISKWLVWLAFLFNLIAIIFFVKKTGNSIFGNIGNNIRLIKSNTGKLNSVKI